MVVREYYRAKGVHPRLVIFEDTSREIEFSDVAELENEIRKVSLRVW